jgi:hypothetical protein
MRRVGLSDVSFADIEAAPTKWRACRVAIVSSIAATRNVLAYWEKRGIGCAASEDRSSVRPLVKGPRSFTRATTVRPVLGLPTTRQVPNGKDLCAAVIPLGLKHFTCVGASGAIAGVLGAYPHVPARARECCARPTDRGHEGHLRARQKGRVDFRLSPALAWDGREGDMATTRGPYYLDYLVLNS